MDKVHYSRLRSSHIFAISFLGIPSRISCKAHCVILFSILLIMIMISNNDLAYFSWFPVDFLHTCHVFQCPAFKTDEEIAFRSTFKWLLCMCLCSIQVFNSIQRQQSFQFMDATCAQYVLVHTYIHEIHKLSPIFVCTDQRG